MIWYYLKWCSFSIANLKLIKYIHPEKSSSSYKTFILYIYSFWLKIFIDSNFAIVSSMANFLKAQSTIKSKIFQIDNATYTKDWCSTEKKSNVSWLESPLKVCGRILPHFHFFGHKGYYLPIQTTRRVPGAAKTWLGLAYVVGVICPFPIKIGLTCLTKLSEDQSPSPHLIWRSCSKELCR